MIVRFENVEHHMLQAHGVLGDGCSQFFFVEVPQLVILKGIVEIETYYFR
jgi:hypothetical protein